MERTQSPITTETDIDLTAALLPSGGTRSHHHAVKTAVSETGPPPAPGRLALSSPAGCQLWNAPYPTRPPGSCPGKGFGQSTQPFSFGTRAAPPRHEPRLTLHHGELTAAASWLGGHGGLKGQDLACWEGPETRPGLDKGSAPPSAFQKPPIWDSCSPWAVTWLCPVKPGRDASPPQVGCRLRAEQGCAGAPPDTVVGLPGGSRGESAGQRGDPVAAETAAEPRQDSGCALSEAPEQPATGQEGGQDVPLPVGAVHLQNSAPAVVGSRQSRRAPSEPDPRGEELPPGGPGRTEEEGEARRPRVTEPGRRSGARSSAGPDCESGEAVAPELASHAQRAGSQEPAGASSPTKTSVEDAYGRLTKACGLSLLEELRRTFLDADGGCFSLLDSGLVLGRVEEHAALGLAFLHMRDGRKLATALPNSSLFLYYALGRQFYVTEKLADRWFRARDRVTGESMLVKKVPVVSDWRKMLHNFLFLPPHPSLLVPYAVLYDRNGSILYLMQDRDVRAVGRPPEGPGVGTARALQEALSFLRYCKHHGFHPGDVGAACIYTAQGICFDPSSLCSSEGPCAFRKSMKTCLRPLLARHQEHVSLDALVESVCQELEEEESPGHSDPPSSQAPGAGLK